MKNIKTFIGGLAVCAMLAAMMSPALAQEVVQGKARVVRMRGHARVTTGGGVWHPVKVGEILNAGSIIQTDNHRGSYVDLVLGDGTAPIASVGANGPAAAATPILASYQPRAEQNVVRVFENTALGIDKLTSMNTGADTVTDTQLDLKSGRIFGSVKKMSAASKYEVKLPNGVAGIRGTTYMISSDGTVQVSSGSVVLAWVSADGTVTTKVVVGGQQFNPSTGEISPLAASALSLMHTIESDTRVFLFLPTRFRVDRTVYHVSPVRGHHHHHHHGDGGDDQGGDEGGNEQ
ncbi:MAG TPA: FecR domain-containing protein [Verrucomicrobiae bacterium]|nr:FecR domain-containing protein [Verrucomicrobiae bacterium]